MTQLAEQPTATEQTDYVARARALDGLIRAEADRIESETTITSEVYQALHDAGMFSMLVPTEYGGAGLGIVEALRTIEEISAADGSTGWALMANAEVLTGPIIALFGRWSGARMATRLASSYPLHNRFRAGLGVVMFSLVIFAMTVMAIITSATRMFLLMLTVSDRTRSAPLPRGPASGIDRRRDICNRRQRGACFSWAIRTRTGRVSLLVIASAYSFMSSRPGSSRRLCRNQSWSQADA